jgi:biopolymer transport protein ExbB/biopolymer transport protein TolQ
MNMSLMELWGTMGWFAKSIVYILLFMSIMVLTISGKKLIELYRARRATLQFSPKFSKALSEQNFENAAQLVEKHPKSHLATTFRRVFPTITFHSADQALSAAEIASVQRLIDLNSLEQLANYRRGLGVLATIGATAPFVGLLGTTMGVVTAFTGMADMGSGGLTAISAGIAEALITTAFGLLVAIPAVWFYNYFTNRVELVSMEIDYGNKEFLNFLLVLESRLKSGGKVA